MTSNPSNTPPASTTTSAQPSRRVVDAPMRMFHWLFALSFAGAYLTAESERWRLLHVTLGYTLAGLLLFRLAYGVGGPRPFRLSALWRKLTAAPAWLQSVLARSSAQPISWRQGQNLVMPLVVVAMLLLVIPLTLSGYGTYQEWGGEALTDLLEEVHEFFGELFLLLVLAHMAWLVVLSVLRRSNMALPMLSGRVAGKGPDVVASNRMPLAILILLLVIAWFVWQAEQSPQGLTPWGNNTHQLAPSSHNDDEDD